MAVEIYAANTPQAYTEALWKMRMCSTRETSMRGDVISIESPVVLTINNPKERVLFDPIRNANPFFHVMEFIWMMAGQYDARWISQFNKNILKSADPKNNVIHGAYGYRWIGQFGVNQITKVIEILKQDPNSRRAVISMWDSAIDLHPGYNDYPCNTHIYFRIINDKLNMTVCNRSNDLIWGMLGANVVHMTMLMEVIAFELNVDMGKYIVFTNNLHMYVDLPNFENIINTCVEIDYYPLPPTPILRPRENYTQFKNECVDFVKGLFTPNGIYWLEAVALPMHKAYLEKDMNKRLKICEQIQAQDWRIACQEWLERKRTSSSSISTEP